MRIRFRFWIPALAITMVGAATASAQTPSGEELYKVRTCIACHGPDAKTPILPDYPKLAGHNAAYTLRQMHDIKSGARSNGNTAGMKGIMHLVSDEDMRSLSEDRANAPVRCTLWGG